MRFQKTIKRIVALGTGAVMMGATLMGAYAAADLANYPSPFIKDGKLHAVLVVGDKAAAEDTIGVSNILVNLQTAAVKKVSTATGSSGVNIEGDAYKIGGTKKLAITEQLSNSPLSPMTIRNASVTLLGGTGGELKGLESGESKNGKGTSPYNQYLHLLGPGSSGNTGYVIYTENNDAETADFLYFKSSHEIGRYVLEFTTPLESDVDDSAGSTSSTGLFLTDYQNTDIKMFGKVYSIVTAKRTTTLGSNVELTLMGGAIKDTLTEKQTRPYKDSAGKDYEVTLSYVDATSAQLTVNGKQTRKMNKGDTDKLDDGTNVGISEILFQNFAGGIHSATFFLGAQKLFLKDTDVTDKVSSNNIKVDDKSVTTAPVIIEGTDNNSTFKINRVTVNMTADDNYFIPAGKTLSENPSLRRPEVLFTQNWDIQYQGIRTVDTEKIKLRTSSDNQYTLDFVDGDGKTASLPIARAGTGTAMVPGDNAKPFVNRENATLVKDMYFIVTDGSQRRGERRSYALQYKGADKVTADSPVLRFRNLGSGETIEQPFTNASPLAVLKIGGASYNVYASDDPVRAGLAANDFTVNVDMDASGAIATAENITVNITTKFGAEIGFTNTSDRDGDQLPQLLMSVKTPDSSRDGNAIDSVDQVTATDFAVNITAASAKVQHSTIDTYGSGLNTNSLNLRTPSGKSNVAYGYNAYGAYITRETPSSNPATFTIEYPKTQRDALVYLIGKGATLTSTESVLEGDAVVINEIGPSATKLATEVSDVKGVNSILVGGPCANAAAATIMGVPMTWPECGAGFEPGVGMIKLYENGDKVAMLVAGYSAEDTRNAATVVSSYKDYKSQLKGMSVEVKKVNNALTVAAPVVTTTTTTTTVAATQ